MTGHTDGKAADELRLKSKVDEILAGGVIKDRNA
jgi:hypothetical protein